MIFQNAKLDMTMKKEEYNYMYQVERELWWYRGLRQVIAFYLNTFSDAESKVLDAGCGTGMNMVYLRSRGYRVSGVDVSSEALSFAKKRGLKNLQIASITSLPFPDRSFDAVLNMDVMGLLDTNSAKRSIKEFYRVLRPGGLLILHCAALEWLRSQHDVASNVKIRYTPHDLRNLFTPTKWRIEKLSFRMFFLFLPLALVKLLRRFTSRRDASGDLYVPPSPLNTVLFAIEACENFLLPYINYPIGTSIIAVVTKK